MKKKYDIGQCKSLRIKCISEVGWFDSEKLLSQLQCGGGLEANQWTIPWTPENADRFCSLIEMESLDGNRHKFLLSLN